VVRLQLPGSPSTVRIVYKKAPLGIHVIFLEGRSFRAEPVPDGADSPFPSCVTVRCPGCSLFARCPSRTSPPARSPPSFFLFPAPSFQEMFQSSEMPRWASASSDFSPTASPRSPPPPWAPPPGAGGQKKTKKNQKKPKNKKRGSSATNSRRSWANSPRFSPRNTIPAAAAPGAPLTISNKEQASPPPQPSALHKLL